MSVRTAGRTAGGTAMLIVSGRQAASWQAADDWPATGRQLAGRPSGHMSMHAGRVAWASFASIECRVGAVGEALCGCGGWMCGEWLDGVLCPCRCDFATKSVVS